MADSITVARPELRSLKMSRSLGLSPSSSRPGSARSRNSGACPCPVPIVQSNVLADIRCKDVADGQPHVFISCHTDGEVNTGCFLPVASYPRVLVSLNVCRRFAAYPEPEQRATV